MGANYEQAEIGSLGYAADRGYSVKLTNRDNGNATKWLRANGYQVALIGDVLAASSEDATTDAREVHLRYAELFADLLREMNAHADDASRARQYYAWQNSKDGHPSTAYAHVYAALECAVAEILPDHAAEVVTTWSSCQESMRYCVEYVENLHRHRISVADASSKQGCWLEGSRGWTAIGALVNIAVANGMSLDADGQTIVDAYLSQADTVTLSDGKVLDDDRIAEIVREDLAGDAETYLNEHVAPEGWAFGWHDGEFFFWPESDWSEVDEG